MLWRMGLPDLPPGINATPTGMCGLTRNKYQVYKEPAYSINKQAIITVSSTEVGYNLPVPKDSQTYLRSICCRFSQTVFQWIFP